MERKNMLRQRILSIFILIAIALCTIAALSGCDDLLEIVEDDETEISDTSEESGTESKDSQCEDSTESESFNETDESCPSEESEENESPAESESQTNPPAETEKPYDGPRVLTYDKVDELSSGKNVVMFIVDRFDENYYEKMVKSYPDYFDRLDGFTHFNNYTSLYARTYPAMASILTGKDHDYLAKKSKKSNLNAFYSDGGGNLGVLKEKGYDINLYTWQGDSYNDAKYMLDYVGNVSTRESDTAYSLDMSIISSRLSENGLKLADNEKQFTLIHLYGCHDTTLSVTKRISVTFEFIYFYLDQMKALGVYDDATIIITGDHPAALSDSKMIGSANSSDDGTRVTAMFFKRSGESGTALKYSSSQISQDNLWNTIFESEGLAELKSGESFFDIPEGENRERRYFFEMYKNSKNNTLKYNKLYEYKIVGNANLSESWTIEKETDIIK